MTPSTETAMTSQGHKKFMFDTDFSSEMVLKKPTAAQAVTEAPDEYDEDEDEVVEEVAPTFTEEDLARARDEGYQAGQLDATRDLTSALEQRLVNTMDTINAQVENLFDAFQRDKEEHSRDSVAVATVIVRKLFPALNMDKAMIEIEHMIVESMKRTSGAPTLIVRVAQDIQDAVQAKADELVALRGHEGTVSVLADAAMGPGDAAVEWDGGGMLRDGDSMWHEIDKIIERNLGSERANGARNKLEAGQKPAEQGAQEPEPSAQEVVNDAAVEDNGQMNAESQNEPHITDEAMPEAADEATEAEATDSLENIEQIQASEDLEETPTQDQTSKAPIAADDETLEEPENGV
ncbi:FliH/SctL family protein [Magnetovibrio blakemorei]|nr:FliH/SctL family protein [Magnetovibrio blakemorei]